MSGRDSGSALASGCIFVGLLSSSCRGVCAELSRFTAVNVRPSLGPALPFCWSSFQLMTSDRVGSAGAPVAGKSPDLCRGALARRLIMASFTHPDDFYPVDSPKLSSTSRRRSQKVSLSSLTSKQVYVFLPQLTPVVCTGAGRLKK